MHARHLRRTVVLSIGLLLPVGVAPAQPGIGFDPADTPEKELARYREHVVTLANPFFEGRGSGTRGNQLASDYVEFWFKQLGLKPAFDSVERARDGTEVVTADGAFKQPFEVGASVEVSAAAVEFSTVKTPDGAAPRTIRLTQHTDFEIMGISGSDVAEGGLVFVGYGIEKGPAPDYSKFSSFKDDDDLSGKVVLLLRYEPMTDKGESQWTVGAWSDMSSLRTKLGTLVDRGAAGVLLVTPPGAKEPRNTPASGLQTTAMTSRGMGKPQEIPIAMITQKKADQIVRLADAQQRSLEDLRKLADKGGGVIPLPGVRATVSATVERPPRMTSNVAAVLPGKGPLASQFLVIGAHFDHIGDGRLGGSAKDEPGKIHFGADDNASGTAGMLVMAERMSRAYQQLPDGASTRSVLFMAFSGEEIGLLGSRHFVQSGKYAASSIYAMLNMDMIGRLRDDKFELHGTGTAEGFNDLLKPLLDSWGVPIKNLPGGRGPSDHSSFYSGGIPVLFFFTGFHEQYHTPRDVSQLVNFEGAIKVLDLVTPIATMLASRTEPLVFKSTEPVKKERPEAPADHAAGAVPAQADQQQVGGVAGTRIRFGIAPGDYSGSDTGVAVGEVYEGTSAADAGIKVGDRLMKWNGAEIDSVETWMSQLGKHKPGDVVTVTLQRKDGKVEDVKVTLKARSDAVK